MKKKYINLACGNVFIDNENWENLDFSPVASQVLRANLLDRLPIVSNSAKLVYSSHFIEHIPHELALGFLRECFRVLSSGGVIRLVTPDLENICREYVQALDHKEFDKAEFIAIELIDQCVRRRSGGRLAHKFLQMRGVGKSEIALRKVALDRLGNEVLGGSESNSRTDFTWDWKGMRRIRGWLERVYIYGCVRMLPVGFRTQNVSMATIGEKHHWLWDYAQLKKILCEVGFENVIRRTHDSSGVADFPFDALDRVGSDGGARKGSQSLFIEATKR